MTTTVTPTTVPTPTVTTEPSKAAPSSPSTSTSSVESAALPLPHTGPDSGPSSSASSTHSASKSSQKTSGRFWRTPHGFSQDGRSNGPSGNELGRQVNAQEKLERSKLWPTPNAMDAMAPRSREALTEALEKGGCANLKDVVAHPSLYPTSGISTDEGTEGPAFSQVDFLAS